MSKEEHEAVMDTMDNAQLHAVRIIIAAERRLRLAVQAGKQTRMEEAYEWACQNVK